MSVKPEFEAVYHDNYTDLRCPPAAKGAMTCITSISIAKAHPLSETPSIHPSIHSILSYIIQLAYFLPFPFLNLHHLHSSRPSTQNLSAITVAIPHHHIIKIPARKAGTKNLSTPPQKPFRLLSLFSSTLRARNCSSTTVFTQSMIAVRPEEVDRGFTVPGEFEFDGAVFRIAEMWNEKKAVHSRKGGCNIAQVRITR